MTPNGAVSSTRILVVEDDPDFRNLLAYTLREAGLEVEAVATGAEALEALNAPPAVVVLDWMLPDLPGPVLCSLIRRDRRATDTSILFASARGEEDDRVFGLESGADDYITKPFSLREFVHRVRLLHEGAINRRSPLGIGGKARTLESGGLMVELDSLRARVDGVEVALRPLELKLLSHLLAHVGEIVSRDDLAEVMWGVGQRATRVLDTHVRRLRAKLGRHREAIETVYGAGYRLKKSLGS